jgi:EAL domain-containing protein (putative c-di-GMP-specific phosphodiesterase class I)/CHASE2 domain-containing sensor protein
VAKSVTPAPEAPPWKLLLWTAVLGLIFGAIGFGEIAEDSLRVVRNNFHQHRASGDIVVVKFDDKALKDFGNWPWPRSRQAELLDKLTAAGANRVMYDINFSFRSDDADDRAFANAIERSGRVILLARDQAAGKLNQHASGVPLPAFTRHSGIASGTVAYNYQSAVWHIPYAAEIGGRRVPSLAASLANVHPTSTDEFPVDYSTNVATIPSYSAGDILSGKVAAGDLRGKDVIVGVASEVLGDSFFVPGYGKTFGVYVHAIGGETLKAGTPIDFGWIPAFVLAVLAAGFGLVRKTFIERLVIFSSAIGLLVVLPAFLEARLVFFEITPALFVLLSVMGTLGWRRYRARGLVNPVSNLPNLSALRGDRSGRNQSLVAAKVFNYEEILAALPPNSERELVEQIMARITVGAADRKLYQGDGGIFAWFEKPRQAFGNHLDALYALFRTPARVGGLSLDLSIAFGVEVGSSRSLPSRLASALVAAEEAAHDGLKWKYYDPESFADASWKLSMLSQLDEAIDRGEVWVAYQPKLDIATRRIVGAEALARWTHPEKGPIAATEFVAAAESSNRIGKLTDFVLEKAIVAAAQLNRGGRNIDMAVNLSARLLTEKGLPLRISALLARHGLAARHLTLELTETAALSNQATVFDMIARLRDIGVRIAIDDYGTGLSTLDYLKKVPADEIKIDQSFVRGILDNRSDRLMVQSTIGLAHSLDRQVVAEGVERREILDLLVELNCDIAQGFAVGRPMSLDSLAKRIASDRKRSAA